MSAPLPTEQELNRKRRHRAASALRAHQGGRLDGVVSFQEAVTDLLSDIMHLRDVDCPELNDLHLDSAWHNARRLYDRERLSEADELAAGIPLCAEARFENGGAQ